MTWTLNGSQIGDLEYAYDADGRVSQKTGSMEQPGLPWTGSMGNTYNADNELTAFNAATMTYDANGNLTSDGTYTYTWDARNHLSSAAGASFVYDAFGRRVQNGGTEYLYDGLNPVQMLSSGTPWANILTGLGIDEYFQWTDSSGAMSFLSDALGSTLALTDSTGTIQTTYNYDPFGATSINYFQSSNSNPFQFTGRENDGTGLYSYRARYYSPSLERFVSQDPAEFKGGFNLYGYTRESPATYIDPLGLAVILPWPWPYPPGNVGGTFHDQDWKCSVGGSLGGWLNGNRCTKACCVSHDACYTQYGCNMSSWLIPPPIFPCGICNQNLVNCLADAILKGKCGCS
jgi:RHS repeat-associated protein